MEDRILDFFEEELALTAQESRVFWPIYNEYSGKRMQLKKEYRTLKRELKGRPASDDENKRLLEMGVKVKENQLNLEKDYSKKFMKVISPSQVVALKGAEEDFKKMLLRRIQQRQMKQQQNNQRRQQEMRRQQQQNNLRRN